MGISVCKPARVGTTVGNGDVSRKASMKTQSDGISVNTLPTTSDNVKNTAIKDKKNEHMKHRKSVTFDSETLTKDITGSQLNKYQQKYIKLKNHTNKTCTANTHYTRAAENVLCSKGRCMGSIVNISDSRRPGMLKPTDQMVTEAREFIDGYYSSLDKYGSSDHESRWQDIEKSINWTGTYHLKYEEICYGAKQAWRNAPRCIGRIQWNNIQVFDARNTRTCTEMFDAICRHIRYCTNKGNIRSGITVFPHRTVENKDFRIWNSQFIRYAGYQQSDGSVIGDPISVEFTEVCKKLGWKGKGTMFDILPLVLQVNGEDPELFELPDDIVLEVAIRHPKYPWFEELGIKWYALPTVTNMIFDCGGLEFPAAPFSGWYMSTEIGARNLCDTYRYNLSEIVATKMGLDTKTPISLWKDKAILEVNVAVLHSFQQDGVTITDHHSASESFMKFMTDEQRSRGGCPADWVWIVPPISGSATPVFHQEMIMYKLKPSYEYNNTDAWTNHNWTSNRLRSQFEKSKHSIKTICWLAMTVAILMRALAVKRVNCTILYSTVTGNAYRYAKILERMLSHAFNAKVVCMNEYSLAKMMNDRFVLVVTSTFGNGDSPESGMELAKEIRNVVTRKKRYSSMSSDIKTLLNVLDNKTVKKDPMNLKNMTYSVFGLGSRAYEHFCAFAHFMNASMRILGADQLHDIGEGDELNGQEISFANWAREVFIKAVEMYHITDEECIQRAMKEIEHTDTSWSPNKFTVALTDVKPEDLVTALSKLHNKPLGQCTFKSRKQLQSCKSSRQTLLVEINTKGDSAMNYRPGDHICIYPANKPSDVNYIISRFSVFIPVDQPIRVEKNERQLSGDVTKPLDIIPVCTLRTALTYFIDITTPPTQALLKEMAEFAEDIVDSEPLKQLAQDLNAYKDWRNKSYPSLKDVLKEFSSIHIPPAFLLTQFPYLKERFYSISSSPDTQPEEVHLTVGVLKYTKKNDGEIYEGVCSSWFNRCKVNDVIPCYVHSTPVFYMPADYSVPIIMVGAGTGIAPFRSFWKQRKYDIEQKNGAIFGPMYLFFGCREPTVDDIYFDELRKAEQENVITNIFHAYSREQGKKKVYVQDVMLTQSNLIFNSLFDNSGHIYVCGETQMAQDVSKTLCEIVSKSIITSPDKAQKIVQSLKVKILSYYSDLYASMKLNKKTSCLLFQVHWIDDLQKVTKLKVVYRENVIYVPVSEIEIFGNGLPVSFK